MKKGLFVGSFNPITKAHENIALDLIKNNIIDYVYFIPVNSNKNDLININQRIEMIKLIKKDKEDILNIYDYSNTGFFNSTVLEKIANRFKITHIIMGSDLFFKFSSFHNYKDILDRYYIIVINRLFDITDYINKNYQQYRNKIIIVNQRYDGSSYHAKKELTTDKNNYLNEVVLKYIKNNKLYKDI